MAGRITFMFGSKVFIDGKEEIVKSISINEFDKFVLNGRIDFERIPLRLEHFKDNQLLRLDGDYFIVYAGNDKYRIRYLDELIALSYAACFLKN